VQAPGQGVRADVRAHPEHGFDQRWGEPEKAALTTLLGALG
jgi:hypothetical protein